MNLHLFNSRLLWLFKHAVNDVLKPLSQLNTVGYIYNNAVADTYHCYHRTVVQTSTA